MAEIRPLRALRYDPARVGDLSRVLCPPYDVLSAEDEERLRSSHPLNFVRVVLPREEEGLDRYRAAAALLERWRADGTLRRDPQPAYYFYEQEYRLRGAERIRRRGVFALVRLRDFADGVVLPHEQTLSAPREDRFRLIEATSAHLDAVFGLYSDQRQAVDRLFDGAARRPPLISAVDPEGGAHRLWATTRPEEISSIGAALDGRWVLIADGHHRYESALRYARSRPAAAGATLRPFDHVLMVLCNIEARGLSVLPIHRLVHSLPELRPEAWLRTLDAWFERQDLVLPEDPSLAARAAEGALAPHRAPGGAFLLAFPARRAHLLTLRPGIDRNRELVSVPAPLRGLDVSVAHALILERGLGISPEEQLRQTRLRHSTDAAEALEEVDSRRAQAAVLLNPTPIDSVVEVTRAGLRLPPKSTFFYPKLISGLVMHPFDDQE